MAVRLLFDRTLNRKTAELSEPWWGIQPDVHTRNPLGLRCAESSSRPPLPVRSAPIPAIRGTRCRSRKATFVRLVAFRRLLLERRHRTSALQRLRSRAAGERSRCVRIVDRRDRLEPLRKPAARPIDRRVFRGRQMHHREEEGAGVLGGLEPKFARLNHCGTRVWEGAPNRPGGGGR